MITMKDLEVLQSKIENNEFRQIEGSKILRNAVHRIKEHERIGVGGIDNYSDWSDYDAWDRGGDISYLAD